MTSSNLKFLFDHYPKKLLLDFIIFHQKNSHVYEEFSPGCSIEERDEAVAILQEGVA